MKSISTAIATTADNIAAVNYAAEQMGWGSGSLTVPLYTGATVTHYGCHVWTDADFPAILDTQPDIKAMMTIVYGTAPAETWGELMGSLGVTDEAAA